MYIDASNILFNVGELTMIMKNRVSDELFNNVERFGRALETAMSIVDALQIENKNLSDAFYKLTSINKVDYTDPRDNVKT